MTDPNKILDKISWDSNAVFIHSGSGCPHKPVQLFRKFRAVLPPLPGTKLTLVKILWYKRPTLFVFCVIWEKAPQMQICSKIFVHDCRCVFLVFDLIFYVISEFLWFERSLNQLLERFTKDNATTSKTTRVDLITDLTNDRTVAYSKLSDGRVDAKVKGT